MKLNAALVLAILCMGLCLFEYSAAQVLPYPGDCTKYQQCDASGCFVLSCGAGTEFNPAIGTCDYPLQNRAGCNNRG
ncbi:hypothetical protein KPH14_009003 [Odynerus spinipes]|uniref:Chitin-binding type-2 domain-containing protein n=1 Tax=Odynerus spinipes TaxID=1348599 RepID=A0AAD9RNG2_9HYME|nr:hypothetical protein KPH14_009003 [Odynerus spinipes]